MKTKVLVKNTNTERTFTKTFGEIYSEQRKHVEAQYNLPKKSTTNLRRENEITNESN